MKIFTKVVREISSGRLLSSDWFEYSGAVALAKGASAQETQIANSQQAFMGTLQNAYNTQFANQSAILSTLNSGWNQIFQAGINQYGFSTPEDVALRTQATQGTAQTYNQALSAVNQAMGAQGGTGRFRSDGQVYSGPADQIRAEIASASANQQAAQQLGITQAGYAQGRQNYLSAAGALGQVASMYNPQSYAGLAGQTGQQAFQMQDTVNKENQAASPWNIVAPILGGLAGSFLGPIGSQLGSSLGGMMAGGGGGGSQSQDAGWNQLGSFAM